MHGTNNILGACACPRHVQAAGSLCRGGRGGPSFFSIEQCNKRENQFRRNAPCRVQVDYTGLTVQAPDGSDLAVLFCDDPFADEQTFWAVPAGWLSFCNDPGPSDWDLITSCHQPPSRCRRWIHACAASLRSFKGDPRAGARGKGWEGRRPSAAALLFAAVHSCPLLSCT